MTGIVDNYRTIDSNRKILTFTLPPKSTRFSVNSLPKGNLLRYRSTCYM